MILQSKKNTQPLHIAYLYFLFLARESLIAGCLVLDYHGFPKDFRFSRAKQPNALQKSLYGTSLESYLIESVTKELVNELTTEPSFCLTNYRFPYSEECLEYPIYYMAKTEESKIIDPLNSVEGVYTPTSLQESQIEFELFEPFTRIEQALEIIRQESS